MEPTNSTSENNILHNTGHNIENMSTVEHVSTDENAHSNVNILPTDENAHSNVNILLNDENAHFNVNILPTDEHDEDDDYIENNDINEILNIGENSDNEDTNDEDDDVDEEVYEHENYEEQYEGYIPHFPQFFIPSNMEIPFGSMMGLPNFHILGNLNNAQEIFDMMATNMLSAIIPNNLINPINQISNVVNEINPSNSGNSILPNTTFTGQPINLNMNSIGNQAMIEEEVQKLIVSGVENLNMVSQPVLEFIENCYLQNMQYEDNIINLIRYTVKNCLTRNTEFEIKELISGIIYYSLGGTNTTFSDNYDDVVLPILHNELKRIVTQSIRLAILRRTIVAPSMEDVKLVVGEDALKKIPISKYTDLEDKIKTMNISCTVCQDDFNAEDKVRILPCEHLYHPDCIDDWLKSHSYKCPCCRKPAAEHSAKI